MRKILFLFFVSTMLASVLLAQQPTATPQSDDGGVVKIATDLIQLDVTVTDRNGKVVTDLGPDDFEIYENGEKQKISNLSFISRLGGGAAVTAANRQNQATTPDTTTHRPLTAEQVRRTFAFIV